MSYFWILHVINSHGENFQQKVQKHPLLWSSQSWWFLTAQRGFTSVILEFWQELLEGLLTWRRGVAKGCDKKHNWPYLSVQHYHHNTPLPLGWSLIKLAMNFLSPPTQYCPHCLHKFGIWGGGLALHLLWSNTCRKHHKALYPRRRKRTHTSQPASATNGKTMIFVEITDSTCVIRWKTRCHWAHQYCGAHGFYWAYWYHASYLQWSCLWHNW